LKKFAADRLFANPISPRASWSRSQTASRRRRLAASTSRVSTHHSSRQAAAATTSAPGSSAPLALGWQWWHESGTYAKFTDAITLGEIRVAVGFDLNGLI